MCLQEACELDLSVGTHFGGVLLNEGGDYGYVVTMFRQTLHQSTS